MDANQPAASIITGSVGVRAARIYRQRTKITLLINKLLSLIVRGRQSVVVGELGKKQV